MRRLKLYKTAPPYSGISKPLVIEGLTIVFEDEIPFPNQERSEILKHFQDVYKEQGEMLEKALFSILPGGTYDQLLKNMLERRASLFRVPHWNEEEKIENRNQNLNDNH